MFALVVGAIRKDHETVIGIFRGFDYIGSCLSILTVDNKHSSRMIVSRYVEQIAIRPGNSAFSICRDVRERVYPPTRKPE